MFNYLFLIYSVTFKTATLVNAGMFGAAFKRLAGTVSQRGWSLTRRYSADLKKENSRYTCLLQLWGEAISCVESVKLDI